MQVIIRKERNISNQLEDVVSKLYSIPCLKIFRKEVIYSLHKKGNVIVELLNSRITL